MTYIQERQKYQRPQGMIWADVDSIQSTNYEIGSNTTSAKSFLILSDDNRSAIDISSERIENRQRMINGRMRSFYVADKLKISVSWEMLPSRRFSNNPLFNTTTGQSELTGTTGQYTTDGGAGGEDILYWYDNHTGPFYVHLAYDKPQAFISDKYNNLEQYSQVIEMYISDFSYSIQKRGGNTHDFWNISVSLEEV